MKKNFAATILRWGLAFVFFYAAYSSLRDPASWVGFIPAFLVQYFPAIPLLTVFSVYEFALAAWLFLGKRVAEAALLAAITLIGIVLVNFSGFIITFRDIGLALAALALFELARKGD